MLDHRTAALASKGIGQNKHGKPGKKLADTAVSYGATHQEATKLLVYVVQPIEHNEIMDPVGRGTL